MKARIDRGARVAEQMRQAFPTHQERQTIPLIDSDVCAAINAGEDRYRQGVLGQAPLSPPLSQDAISQVFAQARETVARLEQERDLIHVGGEWSPSHFAKTS